MNRSSILVMVVVSALLMAAAMFKAPQVTANPSLLYLAGQAKMALGDTTGGLQLISRAVRQREVEQQQMPVPQAKSTQATQASSACNDRSAMKPRQLTMSAKAEPKKFEKKMVTASAREPRLVMAKLSFPSDSFNGYEEVPGMTREEVARVTAEYQQHIQRWTEEQAARQFEMAKLERLAARSSDHMKGRHSQFIKVVVPEPPVMSNFPPEPPRTNP